MTLTEFLLARIDEDEAAARREQDEVAERILAQGPITWAFDPAWEKSPFFPARVLRECEAKRRIVEGMDYGDIDNINEPEVLGLLAAVYSDHPDYRQEWAP